MTALALPSRLTSLNALLARAEPMLATVIAVALAGAMYGQLSFLALRYYSGFAHPAWMAWVPLCACLLPLILARSEWVRPTLPDILLLLFILTVFVSYLTIGVGDPETFAYNSIFFCIIPYLAGRLMSGREALLIGKTAAVLGVISLLLLAYALLHLTPQMLTADRPLLYADDNPATLEYHFAAAFSGISVGTLIVLLTAYVLRPTTSSTALPWWKWGIILLVTCAGAWMVMRVATRASLVGFALVIVALTFFARWKPRLLRLGVLAWLLAALLCAWAMQPPKRVALLEQIRLPTQPSVSHSPFPSPATPPTTPIFRSARPSPIPNINCLVEGDSIATRYEYLRDSARMYRESPIFGIGAGNFGHRNCVEKTDFASPHNILVHAFLETGLPGGLLLSALCLTIIIRLARALNKGAEKHRGTVWLGGALWLFFFVWAQVSGNYFTAFYFYAVTGLIVALTARISEPVHEN